MNNELRQEIAHWLSQAGINSQPTDSMPTFVLLVACAFLATLAYLIVRRGVIRALNIIIKHSKASWDDSFLRFRVLEKLALLVPALVMNLLVPIVLTAHSLLSVLIDRTLSVLIVILFIRAAFAALDAANEIADVRLISRRLPIKSFVQLIKLFMFFVGVIIAISIFANQSPVYFLSGLGVATGLVMLVFRDTILGFVAGIQLAANRMVSRGDWIQMDKYGASGTIEEISLTTVKVRNFDNTLTMIPAYALVQDAFKNWRGMSESGGRRICRFVNIDVSSIHFLNEEELARLEKVNLLKDYLAKMRTELNEYNTGLIDNDELINGRHMTNIGTLRIYLLEYLKHHERIHKNMTLLVRQLQPGPDGLPLEIYAFTNDTRWDVYEAIQADIFDHCYAILPEFGLRAFQVPSGEDMRQIRLAQDLTQP
ncbi:mechanosensitive ion channel family protein [Shewanella sp. NIFS-20-20]|uniref:mechanosensitive ion channel family protein n=1 Tax=Shewanella sp. NIFS-20-20 TaxID=2853806 RepID=UPI001C442ECA|nr:mechanosensitive ion channel domain-containing protein [Shewanella sp. NIFS-20-20]MBV7316101.1 mechanosensitive ion channel family protein [Shewanella sp. NIFS-20-20]